MKKLLLAGPGTGKTTKVKKDFLREAGDVNNILVLSFTNATINDLLRSFQKDGIPIYEKNCITLHSYALRLNHRRELHILGNKFEQIAIKKYSNLLRVEKKLLCEMLKVISYDQMISEILDFAKSNPLYLKQKIGHIELLIVDEYQDFEENERKLIDLISDNVEKTLFLGDDDQAIYGFKDATPEGILALYNDSAIEKIPHENICYRCPDVVVEKSQNLINNNTNRVKKDWNASGIDGHIHFEQLPTQEKTIDWVMGMVKKIMNSKKEFSILLLSPVKNAVEGFIEKFDSEKIPYINFFSKDLNLETYKKVWILRLMFTRYKILNLILIIENSNLSKYKRKKFIELLKKYIQKGFIFSEMEKDVYEFIDQDLLSIIQSGSSFEDIIKSDYFLEISDYFNEIQETDIERKLEIIDQYINIKTIFDPSSVNIMTIHKSKGLEATHVFILGLVDGIIPRNVDSVSEIEAQRRLLFVGMTRAKKFLYLLSTIKWKANHVHQLGEKKFSPNNRWKSSYNGQTSPFVKELNL